ncbi:hypothetical protein MAR_024031, partial [Mya arenaria]
IAPYYTVYGEQIMKFYLHCNEPEVTTVFNWDLEDLTVQNAVDNFQTKLNETTPELKVTVVRDCHGKNVSFTKKLSDAVSKTKNDLFVIVSKTADIGDDGHEIERCHIVEKQGSSTCKSLHQTNGESNDLKTKDKNIIEQSSTQQKLNAAVIHMGNERYRKAIEIYVEILKQEGANRSAHEGLIDAYLRADRYKEANVALKKAFKVYPNDLVFLRLAGEAYIGCKDGEAAVEMLMKCAKLARNEGGMGKGSKQDLQVLMAKAYLIKDEKDMAITILQGVLRENMGHDDALTEYASLLFPIGTGQAEEAVSVILGVLARKPNDKRAREVFAKMMSEKSGMKVLRQVASGVFLDSAALVFLGSCLRDHSVLKESLELFEEALKVDPKNPSIALIYIHTLELVNTPSKIFEVVTAFLNGYGSKCLGNVPCSLFHRYFTSVVSLIGNETLQDIDTLEHLFVDSFDISDDKQYEHVYSEDERYFLAILFTTVKVMYVLGNLDLLKPLLNVLEPLYLGRELHKTNIRNEAAYFNCINEGMKLFPFIPAVKKVPEEEYVYLLGDSHCIPAAWRQIQIQDRSTMIKPALSTGTKIWHLRQESTFYPKANFISAVDNIPYDSTVIVCFGEIDCREALLKCWEKARYDRIEDGMDTIITIYVRVLKELQAKRGWKILVHPVMPVLDVTRPIVMQFNRILATRLLAEPALYWLNFVNELLTEDGQALKPEFTFDGTHANPSYVQLLAESLSQVIDN